MICPKCQGKSAGCMQCNGFGTVTGIDATCVHDYVRFYPNGYKMHEESFKCSKCGRTKTYDSSG